VSYFTLGAFVLQFRGREPPLHEATSGSLSTNASPRKPTSERTSISVEKELARHTLTWLCSDLALLNFLGMLKDGSAEHCRLRLLKPAAANSIWLQ